MAITHATIKAPNDRLFAIADWNAAHIGSTLESHTLAELQAIKAGNWVVPGQLYFISDLAEPLIICGASTSTFYTNAISPTWPDDIILYDTTYASAGNWVITYRKDTIKNLSAYYNWRILKSRRWETAPGNGTFISPIDPGGCAYLDYYTFGNNIDQAAHVFAVAPDGNGDNCINISIGAQSWNNVFGHFCSTINIGDASTINMFGNGYVYYDQTGHEIDRYSGIGEAIDAYRKRW